MVANATARNIATPKPLPTKRRQEYRRAVDWERGRKLWEEMKSATEIADALGVSNDSIYNAAYRYNWPHRDSANLIPTATKLLPALTQALAGALTLSQVGKMVRNRLAEAVAIEADALVGADVSNPILLQVHAETLRTVIESSTELFGWESAGGSHAPGTVTLSFHQHGVADPGPVVPSKYQPPVLDVTPEPEPASTPVKLGPPGAPPKTITTV